MECPFCKEGTLDKRGTYRNEVTISLNEDNCPEFFDDELEDYRSLGFTDEISWECDECGIKVIEEKE